MRRHRAVAVCPHAAHYTRFIILCCKHEVIDDQRVMPICEEIREMYVVEISWIVLGKIHRSLPENVVRDPHPERQSTTESCNAFYLALQRNLRSQKFFPALLVVTALTRKDKT